ncbi:MAG: hypothetical protein ACI4J6_07325 [Oscillospiraceae bacterium]
MKRICKLLLAVVMCLSLFSGCGEGAVGEAQTEKTTAATIVPEGLTAELRSY